MSLTNKTLGGFLWAFGERFGIQALQMVVFVILARILSPQAFGLIGMLAVFIAVSHSLTDSGFGQALIQKKGTDKADYSSVFFINLSFSIVLYIVLYAVAPLIASFYGEPILVGLVRVLGLKFIIASFSMVQVVKLTKEIQFKSLMIAKLPSTLLGGGAGVASAIWGLGVWSLVIQQLVDATAYSIQVWLQSDWRPTFVFDWERVKLLFDFGGKLMISGILHTIYDNLYAVVIGRFFSTAQVGYYTQANKIRKLPVQNIASALGRVSFPVLSKIQDDNERLKRAYKKIIRQVVFFIGPIMIGAIVIAQPLFRYILTDKWLPAVPYFQVLCVAGFFYPINGYNLTILKVKGRSDLFLKIEIIKKIIGTIGVVIIIHYSVLALVIFKAGLSIFAYGINSFYSGFFINYGLSEQIRDLGSVVLSSIFMGIILFSINTFLILPDLLLLILNVILGAGFYMLFIWLFDSELLFSSKNLLLKVFKN